MVLEGILKRLMMVADKEGVGLKREQLVMTNLI
jgi:hypothetical protein